MSAAPVRLAAALATLKLSLQLIWLKPYGFFRDELYYLACARRLAWGYVDHPPLSIAVLRAWTAIFGETIFIRVVPALAGAATIFVTCALAVELGGGTLAVLLTGVCLLSGPVFLSMSHYFSMNSFDILLWPAATLAFLRALRLARTRDWALVGVLLGLGLENKASMLWLGAGLALGLFATPDRAALKTRGPWVAVVIAFAMLAPNALWQWQHGWPTAEFARNALEHKYVRQPPWSFVLDASGQVNPVTALIWVLGLIASLRLGGRRRLVAVAFLAVALLLIVARGKPEYLAAGFPLAFALGGVTVGRFAAKRRWLAALALVPIVVMGAIAAPFALPVLSEDRFIAYVAALGATPKSTEKKELGPLPQNYADMHGWPELAALVDQAAATLSPEERAGAVVWVWTNYGDSGAIELLAHAPPPVVCGHNNYWLWGPGNGDGRAVIVVGGKPENVEKQFEQVTPIGALECPRCMPYENHRAIWVGRGLKKPLAEQWPGEKSYE